MSYWYVEGDDGLRCCYAKTPSFTCPFADGIAGSDGKGAEDFEHSHPLLVAAAGAGITKLDAIVRRAHRQGLSVEGVRDRDDDGKLTDRCRTCGAKLKRLGFAAWLQVPVAEDSSQARIGERLGFAATERVGKTRYFRTKKKAAEWVYRRASESRAKAERAAA